MQKIILALLFSLVVFSAQADHDTKAELENPGMFGLMPLGLPAQCGPSEVVNQYIQRFDFNPETFSVAREGAKAENPSAYFVYTFVSKDRSQHLIVLTSPDGFESCIVSHSFDLAYSHREQT